MGYDTEIVSYKYLYPSFLFPGKTQLSENQDNKRLIIHNLIHSVNPLNWTMVASIITKLRPDLVVIHYWMPFFAPALGVIARKVRRKTGVRVVAITHNLVPHEKHPGWRTLTRFFLRSIDGIATLSSEVKKHFEDFKSPRRAICLYHPVYDIYGERLSRDESVHYLGLDPSKKYLLFFGIIREYKGLELLLNAFSLLERNDLMLIIAGEFYENRKHYHDISKDLAIYDQIIFTDKYIPDNEVRYYFSVAECVVQPYLTATQSGVTQIAYHFDCPMVVTNVGGLPEIVKHEKTGYVCNRDDREIADAIEKILDPVIHSRMVEEIKIEKSRFSWTSFVENIIKLLP